MTGIIQVRCETCDEWVAKGQRWCKSCVEKQIEEE